jgi:hypothetical protein
MWNRVAFFVGRIYMPEARLLPTGLKNSMALFGWIYSQAPSSTMYLCVLDLVLCFSFLKDGQIADHRHASTN